jgi:hypothetical protein
MAASRSRPAVCRYERNSQAGNDRTATSAFWPRVVLSSRTVRTTSTGDAEGPRSLGIATKSTTGDASSLAVRHATATAEAMTWFAADVTHGSTLSAPSSATEVVASLRLHG